MKKKENKKKSKYSIDSIDKKDKANQIKAGAAIASGYLLKKGADPTNRLACRRTDLLIDKAYKILGEENERLIEKLTEAAGKQGTSVWVDPWVDGGAHSSVLDAIKHNNKSAAILAHELGHSKHFKGRDGSKIGKLAHKIKNSKFHDRYSDNKYVTIGAPVLTGTITGYKAAHDEDNGKKASKVGKLATVGVPLAIAAPTLVAEAAASRRGIKALKEAGASKKAIRHARRELGAAYSTYLTNQLGKPVGAGILSRGLGRGIYATEKLIRSKKGKTDSRGKTNKEE